jgi:uncharacterized membrane protein
MWMLGALLGLIVGGMVGGVWVSIACGIIGIFGGVGFDRLTQKGDKSGGEVSTKSSGGNENPPRDVKGKIDHIYQSLGHIHQRLERLENSAQPIQAREARFAEPPLPPPVPAPAPTPTPATAAAPVLSPVPTPAPAPAPAATVLTPEVNASAPATAKLADTLHSVPEPLRSSPTLRPKEPSTQDATQGIPAEASAPVPPEPSVLSAPSVPPAKAASAPPAPGGRAQAPQTAADDAPNFIDRLLSGNIIAKLGVVLLFFGVGFLLKFAYDRGVFPPELRLLGVAIAAAAMLFVGFRLLAKNRVYALILMGGAIGLLYLDTFFALKNFALISPPFAFALFFALGVAMTLMAVKLDAKVLAVLGLVGAFMAPILASTGAGSHVLLFSYYLMLNLFIFAVSWFKSWRELNLTGFIFTFAIALFWGHSNYQPVYFNSVEPFLLAFFALYVAIPVVFAHRQPPELKGLVDGTLIFGTPLSCAMMQAALTRGMADNILAWSAAGVALVYAALAWALWRRANMRVLAEAHLALAIVFGTVAPYFAFEAYPTFAFWALEGAAIVWLGCRQDRPLARAFGVLVQVGAAVYFAFNLHWRAETTWLNSVTVGAALIAVSAWISAWLLYRAAEKLRAWERSLEALLIAWGVVWWLGGGLYAVSRVGVGGLFAPEAAMQILLFATASFVAWEWAGAWLGWVRLRLTHVAHVAVMLLLALLQLASLVAHPLAGVGALAWPVSFAAFFWLVHRQRTAGIAKAQMRYWVGWALMLAVASWEAVWRYDQRAFGWVWMIALAGFAAAALRYRLREQPLLTDAGAAPGGAWAFSTTVLAWAMLVWLAAAFGYADVALSRPYRPTALLLYVAVTAALLEWVGRLLQWRVMRQMMLILPLAMLLSVLELADRGRHPGEGIGVIAWPACFAVWLGLIWRQERDRIAVAPVVQSSIAFWLAVGLALWEVLWRADHYALVQTWRVAGIALVIGGATAMLLVVMRQNWWPIRELQPVKAAGQGLSRVEIAKYVHLAPMLIAFGLWTFAANVSSNGAAPPLGYLPVLNPLDMAQLMLFAVAWTSVRTLDDREARSLVEILIALAAFFWINGVLLRTVHHWAEVPFEWRALTRAVEVQASFSILWTASALVLMTLAGKRGSRALWGAGAMLLGLVIVKLFINDLGNTGTVARIVSFIGVGLLLLVIGYVAPVPPRQPAASPTRAPDAVPE